MTGWDASSLKLHPRIRTAGSDGDRAGNVALMETMLLHARTRSDDMAVTRLKDGSTSIRHALRADVPEGARMRIDVPSGVVADIDPEYENAVAIRAIGVVLAADAEPMGPDAIIAPLVRACTALASHLSTLLAYEETFPTDHFRRVRVHCPSPFGPARASMAVATAKTPGTIEIPPTILDHYGIGGGWMIHHSRMGSPMTIVSAASGTSPLKPAVDVAVLLRNPFVEGMRRMVEALSATCEGG